MKWNELILASPFKPMQVMISKLPDKGEKLRKRITELNRALTKLKMEQTNVVDLDDITDEFERVVNV